MQIYTDQETECKECPKKLELQILTGSNSVVCYVRIVYNTPESENCSIHAAKSSGQFANSNSITYTSYD